MAIDVRGIGGDRALEGYVRRRLEAAVARLPATPVEAEVLFLDVNGPKGGVDLRCTLTVRVPYRPALRVEYLGQTRREAFDLALPVLQRRLGRYAERYRESQRRPKKYYVAKRLLTGAGEPGGTRTAARR